MVGKSQRKSSCASERAAAVKEWSILVTRTSETSIKMMVQRAQALENTLLDHMSPLTVSG